MSECLLNEKNQEISVVQGDSLNVQIEIEVLDSSIIDKVYLIDNDLNLEAEASLTEHEDATTIYTYTATVSKDTTALFSKEFSDYDIKILFVGGDIFTPIYKNGFHVKINKNKLNE